tara:strand:+ start:646 stop:1152 length:507 start_codon:yes stop_codon:yes gene_type:complete
MAFKMKRPFKMKAPLKRAGLNIGKSAESGVYYNSDMGPMKMHSPSALKAMEEEMAAEGGGMEEMMGMMGGGEEMGGPPPEAPPTEEGGGEDGDPAESVAGQEIEIKEDGTMVMSTEYDVEGIPSGATVEDPDGLLEIVDGYVMDNDYTFEVQDGTVIITGERELEPGE